MKVKVDYFDWTTFFAQKQHVRDSDKHVICKKRQISFLCELNLKHKLNMFINNSGLT